MKAKGLFFSMALQPKATPCRLVLKFQSKTHLDTHTHAHPAGFLWMSDQVVANTTAYTTHNIHQWRTSMPSVGFKPAIPAIKQPHTYALVCTATGIGIIRRYYSIFYVKMFRVHPVVLVSNRYVNKSTVYTTVFIKVKKWQQLFLPQVPSSGHK
jgi:hypothetical protein